jgi:hypothetical protein
MELLIGENASIWGVYSTNMKKLNNQFSFTVVFALFTENLLYFPKSLIILLKSKLDLYCESHYNKLN